MAGTVQYFDAIADVANILLAVKYIYQKGPAKF